ncbi:MAG: putative GTP-binding protein EngB [Holosporales bacterium]
MSIKTQEEYAQWLFKQACTFVRGVTALDQLPDFNMPEIAFAGRSNVGKSSLINAIMGRKDVARTSNTPGRTQQLNFFNIQDIFYLVDMPGYGYAEAPKKLVQQWQKLIKVYLLGRPTLERVYVLIDSRHGLKENDTEFMKMLDQTGVSYQIILTKTDKIGKNALLEVHEQTTKALIKHGAAHPTVLITSSEKNEGIEQVRLEIANLCCKPEID